MDQPGDECRDEPPRPLDAVEMRAWQAFLQASTLALEALDRALAACNLTLGDYEIMVFLSAAPEHAMTMSKLAQQSLMAKSRLTYRVDRLEKEGLVARQPCTDDARSVWATLTPAGLKTLERTWPQHLASVRQFVIDPVNRRDLAATTRALDAMVDALGGSHLRD